jgi:hypothetical protein
MKRDKYKMERYQSETARVTNICSMALVAGTLKFGEFMGTRVWY